MTKKEIEIIIVCILLFILGISLGLMISKENKEILIQNKDDNKKINNVYQENTEYYSISENIKIYLPNNWSLFEAEDGNHSFINSDTALYLKDWEKKGSNGFGWIMDSINIKKINTDEYNTKKEDNKLISIDILSYYKTTNDTPMIMDRGSVSIYYIKFNHGEIYKLTSPKDIGNNFIAEYFINNFEIKE